MEKLLIINERGGIVWRARTPEDFTGGRVYNAEGAAKAFNAAYANKPPAWRYGPNGGTITCAVAGKKRTLFDICVAHGWSFEAHKEQVRALADARSRDDILRIVPDLVDEKRGAYFWKRRDVSSSPTKTQKELDLWNKNHAGRRINPRHDEKGTPFYSIKMLRVSVELMQEAFGKTAPVTSARPDPAYCWAASAWADKDIIEDLRRAYPDWLASQLAQGITETEAALWVRDEAEEREENDEHKDDELS